MRHPLAACTAANSRLLAPPTSPSLHHPPAHTNHPGCRARHTECSSQRLSVHSAALRLAPQSHPRSAGRSNIGRSPFHNARLAASAGGCRQRGGMAGSAVDAAAATAAGVAASEGAAGTSAADVAERNAALGAAEGGAAGEAVQMSEGGKGEGEGEGEEDPLVQHVVIRRDLIEALKWPLGSVITQGCHASVAVVWQHRDHPHVLQYCGQLDSMRKVTLEVKGETQLLNLSKKLQEAGIVHRVWMEQPENIPTCIATLPHPKSIVGPHMRKLKLCK
ncbi:hypothetical protein CLOM_g11150 [Closterium sp. NIES-68]|nr:hypothetical protein CLOM_g11150 [Closterium sp. NIES-68]GJP79573.1 hypothetical protein CLOP_g9793 [Closterium sp. NIES-67]